MSLQKTFQSALNNTAEAFSTSRLSILEVERDRKLTLPNLKKWERELRTAQAALNDLIESMNNGKGETLKVEDVEALRAQLVKTL